MGQKLTVHTSTDISNKINKYPKKVQLKINILRDLILETASSATEIEEIEETLKWGEPSYKVKKGSPIRIAWQDKHPNQYAMYFNCNTTLVETFKTVYGNLFKYEKNRAIVFDLEEEIPVVELKACILTALKYHTLKQEHLLGF